MSDPFLIFRNTPNRHATLKALWPELHDCLAGADKPTAEKVILCPMGDCPDRRRRGEQTGPAVARISDRGHWACAKHVAELADRPGGWPMHPYQKDAGQ